MPPHDNVRVSVRYTDPISGAPQHRTVQHVLAIGRMPGSDGLTISATDDTISRCACTVTRTDAGASITNTSSFTQIDVRHAHGIRFLFPGETLIITEDASVLVPGAAYLHRLDIEVSGVVVPVRGSRGTRALHDPSLTISPERLPALAALCASRFYPQRFGTALLTAAAISQLLATAGQPSTPKAVNNKIQRTREQLAQQGGVFLDTREELADYLIRNGLVNKDHVDRIVSPCKPAQ